MKRLIEDPVKPEEVVGILAEAEIVSVTAWPKLEQVRRIEIMDTNGVSYRIDVGDFVRIKEEECQSTS